MTPARSLTAAALILCLALTLCACSHQDPAPSTEPTVTTPSTEPTVTTAPPTEPEPDAQAMYDAVKAQTDALTDLMMEYEYEEARTIGSDTYTESRTGTASYTGLSSDSMEALIVEDFAYGGYSTAYFESYLNGSGWSRVNNSSFQCQMSAGSFLDRQIPPLPLDRSLYEALTVEKVADGYILTFENAAALESWLPAASEAALISASGKLFLNTDGGLIGGQYQAEYTLGEILFVLHVSVSVTGTENVDFSTQQPVYPENAPIVDDLEILKYLLRTVGAVYAAPNLSVDCTDSVNSQAMGQIREQTSSYDLFGGSSDSFMAGLSTQVTVTDTIGNAASNSQTGVFRDGAYTYSYNGGSSVTDSSITAQQIRMTLEDSILSALVTPDYIGSAQITDYGDLLVINIGGNDLLSASLCRSIYGLFGVDLDAFAESYTPGSITAYLTVDQYTGLPAAMGISLSRSHTINGIACLLTYELNQTLSFSAASAYESITGEPYIPE